MILPYIYDSRVNAERIADRLKDNMDKYEILSINSAHEIVNELPWLQDTIDKPSWMKEQERRYANEGRGWNKKDFRIHVKVIRLWGGARYVLELPDPIQLV